MSFIGDTGSTGWAAIARGLGTFRIIQMAGVGLRVRDRLRLQVRGMDMVEKERPTLGKHPWEWELFHTLYLG